MTNDITVLKLTLGSFEIHWIKQYVINVVLKGLLTVKLKSNSYIWPVNIYPIFSTGFMCI